MWSTSRELSLGHGRKLQLLFKCNLDILKSAVMDLSPWRQIFYPSFLHQKSALHSQIWSSLHGLSYGGYMLIKLCPNEQQKLTERFCSPPFQLILTVILFFKNHRFFKIKICFYVVKWMIQSEEKVRENFKQPQSLGLKIRPRGPILPARHTYRNQHHLQTSRVCLHFTPD